MFILNFKAPTKSNADKCRLDQQEGIRAPKCERERAEEQGEEGGGAIEDKEGQEEAPRNEKEEEERDLRIMSSNSRSRK